MAVDDLRVLLIEDESPASRNHKLKLELDGYHVEVASEGASALQMAAANPPDIVFLDLDVRDGLEVLQELREHEQTRYLPVVVLSSYDVQQLEERGLELGPRESLIKSYTPHRPEVTILNKAS